MERIADVSPRFTARLAGVFYLMVFVTGFIALAAGGKIVVRGDAAATAANILAHEAGFQLSWVVNFMATVCYVIVTALLYELFKPVSRNLSLSAAFFSILGCTTACISGVLHFAPLMLLKGPQYAAAFTPAQLQALSLLLLRMSGQAGEIGLAIFGFYCLHIGLLVIRSTFMPRLLGVGMLIAAAGWLTFLWPPLSTRLIPFNMLPGILGEALLTFWLIAFGVNEERWYAQAGATRSPS